MPDVPDNRIPIIIDGQEVRVPPGTNVIEAARLLGLEIPHYCYHPKLSVVGNCRMCLVEMGMVQKDRATGQVVLDNLGQPRVQWMPRPTIACATTAAPGLHIRTNSPLVRECREGVMEMLLVNHPLDCPICDQAGECRLQEFATDYGRGYSRYVEEKNVKPKRVRLGPRVTLDDERCILCSRCIRFCQEIAKDDVLGFTRRGSQTVLTCFPGRELDHNYSLNTVDICPVGALTSTDFRFRMRVWFLKQTPSLCAESSTGVNTTVWSREGQIYRITPRRNDQVNDTWMPDSGRELYRQVESDQRLLRYALEGRPVELPAALAETARLLRAEGPVAIVGGARASLEEQFLLHRLAQAVGAARVDLVARPGSGDGLLLSADRNPNVRGALLTRLVTALPEPRLDALAADLAAGRIRTVLAWGEDVLEAGLTLEHLRPANLICAGSHYGPANQYAKVELPLLTVFEREGSFVNQQFRVQRFRAAVPGPAGLRSDLALLAQLLGAVTGEPAPDPSLPARWTELAAAVPELAGWTHDSLGPQGRLADASAFRALPFPEGPGLHFDPAHPPAALPA